MDELWRGSERFIGTCAKCGREGLKQKMATVLIRKNGHSSVKTLCHLCPNCLPRLLDELAVSMPE